MDFDKFMNKYGLSPSSQEAYYAELAANEVSKGWISVDDELPLDMQEIIGKSNHVGVCVGYFTSYKAPTIHNLYKENKARKITHWMPLPEPPCKN